MYQIFFVILFIVIVCLPSGAHTARCTGTFSLGTETLPSSLDPTSLELNSQMIQRGGKIIVRLKTTSDFNTSLLKNPGISFRQLKEDNTYQVRCKKNQLAFIAAQPGVLYCSASLIARPLMDSVRNQCRINEVHAGNGKLQMPYTGKGVLVGIIDSEFDTHHPAFLDSNGITRFIALWDQFDSTGTVKNPYNFGTIKNHEQLLADSLFGQGNDSHGTHTTSTAAGSDHKSGYYGSAPDAMIAGVRYNGTNEIPDGLRWICSLADSLKVPCVINMSIGTAYGPHDGTSVIDHVIDSLSSAGRIIVGAAGNDGGIRTHIKYTLASSETGKTWILPRIDSHDTVDQCVFGAQFWGEKGLYFSGTFQIRDRRTPTYLQSSTQFSTLRSRTSKVDTLLWNDTIGNKTDTIYMQYAVTRADPQNNKPSISVFGYAENPSIVIGVTIENPNKTTTTIHGWNLNRAAFHNLGTPGFSIGDTEYTVNEIGGTAKRNITVGAYTARTVVPLWNGSEYKHDNCIPGDVWISSGTGPTIDDRVKPDITAPGWSIVAAISRNAKRDRDEIAVWPDTTTTLSRYGGETGTSMASPVVAGIVALLLEAEPTLTPEEAKSLLMSTALNDQFTGQIAAPVNKWGAGKVNAEKALLELLNIMVTRKLTKPPVKHGFPRIANNQLYLPDEFQTITTNCSFSVTDLRGRLVFHTILKKAHRVIPLPPLAAGVYSIRLLSNENSQIRLHDMFVVQ